MFEALFSMGGVDRRLTLAVSLIAALSEDKIYAAGTAIDFDFDPQRAQLFPPEE